MIHENILAGQKGVHNIETEIAVKGNNKLVAHDSEGFEAGRSDEVDVVKDFIERRSKMRNINNKLHIVWSVKLSVLIVFRLTFHA